MLNADIKRLVGRDNGIVARMRERKAYVDTWATARGDISYSRICYATLVISAMLLVASFTVMCMADTVKGADALAIAELALSMNKVGLLLALLSFLFMVIGLVKMGMETHEQAMRNERLARREEMRYGRRS